jgi:hypothetical protein
MVKTEVKRFLNQIHYTEPMKYNSNACSKDPKIEACLGTQPHHAPHGSTCGTPSDD